MTSSAWTTSAIDADAAAIGEQRVERGGLRNRARETVEHEAVRRVRLLEPLGHDRDHEIVADERAALQRVADERADARAVLDRFAQHVAGGDFRDAVPRRKAVGLRALARSRGPEEDEVERHRRYGASGARPEVAGQPVGDTKAGPSARL